MSNSSNFANHIVFGCPTEDQTHRLSFPGDMSTVCYSGEPNEFYRLMSTADCMIAFKGTGEALNIGTGAYMSAGIPEVFSTNNEKYVLCAADYYGETGELFITKMV